MRIDSHAHLFSREIIAAVSAKADLVRTLCLEADRAAGRTSPEALRAEAGSAGVDACLLLPTAAGDRITVVNRSYLSVAQECGDLHTLGTLHPHAPGNEAELDWFGEHGIRGVKLCSFSQQFDLEASETRRMFDSIRAWCRQRGRRLFVVLDTFCQADRYFGAPPEHLTTPARLARLAARYPEIDFVGAHMGGLMAPAREMLEHLIPRENLYLDTSNAAHTMAEDDFVALLRSHGPARILFGTDWPWFGHQGEIDLIDRLLDRAGFTEAEKAAVFGGNVARLLGQGPCHGDTERRPEP